MNVLRPRTLALFASTALVAAGPLVATPAQAQEGPFIYLSRINAGDVGRIDIPTDALVAGSIATGNNPFGIAVRSDQSLVYVANQGVSDNVAVIDTASHTVVSTIPVGNNPAFIALSRDNTRLYVANPSSNNVSAIDTVTNTVIATIPVGTGPSGIAVSPDGNRVYAANNVTNNVSVIDTVTNTVITTVPVGDGPFGLAVSPDGSVVYVANNDTGNNVSVIRTADNTVVATIAAGNDPRGIVFSPDGTRAYVANQGPGAGTPASVSVIDTATRTVIDTFIVSATQYTNIGISPDGRRLYVPDTVGATVHIVDAATGALVATVPIGQFAIAASACGNGNDLLMAGRTFVAKSAGAIGCTGASGPVFTGGTMQIQGANFTSNLSVNVQAQGGTITGDIAGTGGLIKTAPARCC